MNILRKLFFIFLIIMVIIPPFFGILPVEASNKTLQDLYNELEKLRTDEQQTHTDIKRTEAEINQTKRNITSIYNEMDAIGKEIIVKNQEIAQLAESIIERDKEIKELMRFIQFSSGDLIYLEYIMGADTLADFIYRIAVAEQLTKHNSNLIDEMNNMIEANELKKIELAQKEQDLTNRQAALKKQVDALGQERSSLYEYDRSLQDELKTANEVIKMYENAGCKPHENIATCANRLLPPDTRFWRPMVQGYVTSEYGMRIHPISGTLRLHDGIDLSNSDRYNTRIYATANGKVASIGYTASMGYYVIIHHNINNKGFTSQYLHLKAGSIRVKNGDLVSKDTIIATMGTTGSSTGEHLHFAIANGHRYKDYYTYADFVNKTVNPRTYVNFPSGRRVFWYNRINLYN